MHFGSPDRPPYWEMIGYWDEALERWHTEGLPEDVHHEAYFGLDRWDRLPIDVRTVPRFKREVLAEDELYRVERVGAGTPYATGHLMEGATIRVRKDAHQGIPQFVSFPVTDRASWNEFKQRLNPGSPARYPLWWEDYKRCLRERDYPVAIRAGSLFGWPRDWMGIERASTLFYDDPALMSEIIEFVADFTIETITPALEEIGDIDFAQFWEDMCYHSASIISPKLVREFMLPHYRRITAVLRKYGVDVILVDCDGNHDELTPIWLAGGLNGVYPLEVAAGEDPVRLRKEYGRDLLKIGRAHV